MSLTIIIPGHCYSLKNHRPIFQIRQGKPCPVCKKYNGRPILGKSQTVKDYQRKVKLLIQTAWGARARVSGRLSIHLRYYYAGKCPDALGFAETIFDAIEEAGIVADDVQLVPCGLPAIDRIHVKAIEERVEIKLGHVELEQEATLWPTK